LSSAGPALGAFLGGLIAGLGLVRIARRLSRPTGNTDPQIANL
jgi:hypothetical protein